MSSAPSSSAPKNLFLGKRVDLLALDHLSQRCSSLDQEQSKRVKEALQVLSQALGVDANNKSDKYKYGLDATLSELVSAGGQLLGSNSASQPTSATPATEDVFQTSKFIKYLDLVKKKGAFDQLGEESSPEYQAMLEKVKAAYVQKFEPSKPQLSVEEAEKQAEAKKALGNEQLAKKDFTGAVELYSQALELSSNGPNSHIFLSNRAAAYTYLEDFEMACADCHQAIALKPDFSKAHSRLASAEMSLGNAEAAKQSATRALELDPQNGVAIALLEQLRKESSQVKRQAAPAGGGGFPGGFPGMGGGGGMPDLAAMMNNPMMAQMMKDPAMMAMAQQMASDPNAMKNLMGMMGGGKQ
ncbi:hypothetical protein BASA81_001524 [Batrachochytrium salamandrivorans]|nr:hypothetical protein BASA81_001524 [Batrachochytrium salamandrivorans]